jgi:CHAT domain-containing protein/Tfp pilus assembly protein PilF
MKPTHRLCATVLLALIGSVQLAGPSLAQQSAAAALNARITELQRAGRYAEAIPLAQRLVVIEEKKFGPLHRDFSAALNNLALLYSDLGNDSDAEPLYQRSLGILEKALGADHPAVAATLNNIAALEARRGHLAEAEPLFKRALAIREKALGRDHADVGVSLNNLATLYVRQGHPADAEPLLKRAIAILEKALGRDSPALASLLDNLGQVYRDENRAADAEAPIKRSLAIREKTLGRDHPDVARSLNNLAGLYKRQHRVSDARPLYQRALTIRQKALGPDHPDVARSLNNLAVLYQSEGRLADAAPLFGRSLEIRELSLGPEHPELAESLNAIADFYRAQGRDAEALALVERAIASGRALPVVALPVLAVAQRQNLISAETALDLALNVVQRTNQSSAASAVNKLAVRLGAGNDRLAELVRTDQDLAAEAETLDKAIIAAVSRKPASRDALSEQRSKDRLAAIAVARGKLQRMFATEFPDYAALSNPTPLTAKDIQTLLSDDEAIALFSVAETESYVFVLTKSGFTWSPIASGAAALAERVAAFRRGLNVAEFVENSDDVGRSKLFDLNLANEFYLSLLGPVEALIGNKRSLVVVPTGALTALPFALLVTDRPAAAIPQTLDGYRDAAWLLKRHAINVLPSVASLKALRLQAARNDRGGKPMIGFGDPLFDPDRDGNDEHRDLKTAARNLATGAYTDFWQGAGIDRVRLARALPPLPDTADELNAIARSLGVAAGDVHLGRDASETTLKRAPLADYRIVYFATHGLVAGDVKGLAEPSLALSMPKQPSELDDGLLTSSEVAQLRLNADWVVLSACNTIAGDKPGAEALSGLARSFFYAGARALLVSHWSVESNAATRITTATFDFLKSDPKLGRADALRRAMLAYLNDRSSPHTAYPAFWAPFALIGEGEAR